MLPPAGFDGKRLLGDCRPLKTPANKDAIHPTSKLVGSLADFIDIIVKKDVIPEKKQKRGKADLNMQ